MRAGLAICLGVSLATACAPPMPLPDDAVEDAGVAGAQWSDAGADLGAPDDGTSPTEPSSPAAEAPSGCVLGPDAPLVLLYASVGGDDNLDFLSDDCAAEVVVGEKRDTGPRSALKTAEAHARGGRTAYVMDLNGRKIIDALSRTDGTSRTADELVTLLDTGYDYIVIDEITAAPEWRDGSTVNRRFRRLLELLPERSVIAYVSLDLTMAAGGGDRMRERRQLLHALQQHGRALALEIYLHTGEVRAGLAPAAFRTAASRLRSALLGLPDGGHVNDRAISVLGMSIHGPYPQYRYLDRPAHDLWSVREQARVIRTEGVLLGAQRGIGYYFVGHSDLLPAAGAPYFFSDLLDVMTEQARLASAPEPRAES